MKETLAFMNSGRRSEGKRDTDLKSVSFVDGMSVKDFKALLMEAHVRVIRENHWGQ